MKSQINLIGNMKLEPLKAFSIETSLSIHTLRKFCRQGMPHYRVGKKILIDRTEFEPWFASHFRPAGAVGDLDTIVSDALASLDQNTN
jgi:hypothetical protein